MSETVKTVVTGYMFCAFIGGILEYLAPPKAKSILRIVVTIVVLFVTLTPIIKSDISFSSFILNENDSNTKIDALMHTANLTEKKIYNEIREILINLHIDEYEIYVTTSVDEEKNIVYLEEIKVELSEEFTDKTEIVKSKISEEYKDILKVGVKNE